MLDVAGRPLTFGVRNTYAWNNLTNVVWVEQPVGTGYTQGTVNATDEIDVASQFRGFWRNFVDTFDLQNRKVYIVRLAAALRIDGAG